MKRTLLLLLLLTLPSIYGCGFEIKETKERIKKRGLLQNHSLVPFDAVLVGQRHNVYFQPLGKSKHREEMEVAFRWKTPDNTTIVTIAPYDNLEITYDKNTKKPFIRFVFYKGWLQSLSSKHYDNKDAMPDLNKIISDGLQKIKVFMPLSMKVDGEK